MAYLHLEYRGRSFFRRFNVRPSILLKLHMVVPHHDDGRLGDLYIAAREPPDAMYEKVEHATAVCMYATRSESPYVYDGGYEATPN